MKELQNRPSGNGGFLGHVQQMLQTHPAAPSLDRSALLECIQACIDCAQTCIACSDACLSERDPKALIRCIRLDQDCASICSAAGEVLTRQTAFESAMARTILQACKEACRLSSQECGRHAQMMAHCRICAEASKRCEEACDRLLAAA
jgi:hypothetical protein